MCLVDLYSGIHYLRPGYIKETIVFVFKGRMMFSNGGRIKKVSKNKNSDQFKKQLILEKFKKTKKELVPKNQTIN